MTICGSVFQQSLFATAKESTRYAINGVLWEMKGKKLTLVATDGRRLARSRVNLAANPSEKAAASKIIVPAKTMALLEKLAGGEKDKVAVRLVDNQVMFACGNVVVCSNLVDGNFPKYEDIIPAGLPEKADAADRCRPQRGSKGGTADQRGVKRHKISRQQEQARFLGQSARGRRRGGGCRH